MSLVQNISFAIVMYGIVAVLCSGSLSVYAQEVHGGLDTDHDGLSDSFEKILSTHNEKIDTDSDGYSDFLEVKHGYNPLGEGVLAVVSRGPQASKDVSVEEYNRLNDFFSLLVDIANPRIALDVLRRSSKNDTRILRSCHELVHGIGHAAYAKYKSAQTALQFHNDMCGSGYLHGVLEAALGSSHSILKDAHALCVSGDAKCYHGIGHGFMYFTDNDLPKSLAYCSAYKKESARKRCSEGVFMENFSSDQLLHPIRHLNSADPFALCRKQKKRYKDTCYFYAPRYVITLHKDAATLLKQCSKEGGYRDTCMIGMGSALMKKNIDDPTYVERLCAQAQKTEQKYCIQGMVSYYIVHYDSLEEAKKLCPTLSAANVKTCRKAVASHSYLF
ncbi:hypothetical protein HY620_02970 [Candidatus Uhrbacteria bacterium]|nr:hypothetical protein [Candidatus Uhrbacteria bacterium]